MDLFPNQYLKDQYQHPSGLVASQSLCLYLFPKMTEVEHLWIMKTALILPSKHTMKTYKQQKSFFSRLLGNFNADQAVSSYSPTVEGESRHKTQWWWLNSLFLFILLHIGFSSWIVTFHQASKWHFYFILLVWIHVWTPTPADIASTIIIYIQPVCGENSKHASMKKKKQEKILPDKY